MDTNAKIKLWLNEGKIKKQDINSNHIKILLKRSKKDVVIAKKVLNIDYETAYLVAYNSMLKSARALMFSKGYRPDDGSQHKTTIEFCSCFIDKNLNVLDVFSRMRRNRNVLNYNPYYYNCIDEGDTLLAIEIAEKFISIVSAICNSTMV
ncbi:MAG: HEPN domain-containing protein [Pseudomonadota bacterium]